MCQLYFLHKSGFAHQRLRSIALQQDQLLRERFAVDISLYSTDMYVFETGADRRNTLLQENHSLFEEKVSAIACMSLNGILDVKTHKETSRSTTDIFFILILSHTSVLLMDLVFIQLLYLTTVPYTTAKKSLAPSGMLE